MFTYTHKTQYYETDKMGIIHHSNYIRWFEEARIAFMDEKGYPYTRLESEGIIIPVLTAECEYRKMIHFGDTARIEVELEKFNGIKMFIGYRIYIEGSDEICTVGHTSHCFLDKNNRPVSMKKDNPEFYEAMLKA